MRRRKIEGKEETRGRNSKAGAKTDIAMIISVAKEVNAPSADDNKVCSNGGS